MIQFRHVRTAFLRHVVFQHCQLAFVIIALSMKDADCQISTRTKECATRLGNMLDRLHEGSHKGPLVLVAVEYAKPCCLMCFSTYASVKYIEGLRNSGSLWLGGWFVCPLCPKVCGWTDYESCFDVTSKILTALQYEPTSVHRFRFIWVLAHKYFVYPPISGAFTTWVRLRKSASVQWNQVPFDV